jgi:hypothetical protein
MKEIKDRLFKDKSVTDLYDQGGVDPNPTDTAKLNYTASGYGNEKGSIVFGHIHEKGDVTAGVMLRTPDGKHFMSMDIDDQRKGYTTFAGPGNFTIEAGSANETIDSTIMINSKKGDIQIVAKDGNIRLEGNNIELVARGEGGSGGNIRCVATENFVIENTKKVLLDASMQFKITSPGDVFIAANSMLGIYGALTKAVSDACSKKPSKNSNANLQKRFTK